MAVFNIFLEKIMTSDKLDVLWPNIKATLKGRYPEHTYRMWIEPLFRITPETHGKLVIGCPNTFSKKRVTSYFLPQIQSLAGDTKVKLTVMKVIPVEKKVLHFLPLWPEDQFASPSSIVRSSLFSILNRHGKRRYLKDEAIASWKGTEIVCSGFQFDQADFEVFMYVCKVCSMLKIPLGELVSFERAPFLREIGRHVGSRKWLITVFKRLQHGQILIIIDGIKYVFSLIQEFKVDGDDYNYAFALNYNLNILFGKDYVWINKEDRLGLKGNHKKWLHAYISSHKATPAKPHMIGLEKLHWLCGSENEFRRYKYDVKEIMEFFKKERGWVDYEIGKNSNVLEFCRFDKKVKK